MTHLSLSLHSLHIAATIPAVLAILLTVLRLVHRKLTRNCWWDDFWAAIALVNEILFFSDIWTRRVASVESLPLQTRIALFWVSTLTFPIVVWASRISIALSIARVFPPSTSTRRLMHAVTLFFSLCCLALLLQKIIVCTSSTAWHSSHAVQCRLGPTLGYISIATDIAADTLLVGIPLRLLWNIKLPRTERRLILLIFSANVVMTLGGIVYTVFNLNASSFGEYRGPLMALVTALKAAIALIVCNLLVLVTLAYRLLKHTDPEHIPTTKTSSDATNSHPHPTTNVLNHHSRTQDSDLLSFTQLSFTQITMASIAAVPPPNRNSSGIIIHPHPSSITTTTQPAIIDHSDKF